jgi:hypothetical protein
LKHRRDTLNRTFSQLFHAAGRLKSIEPVGVFSGMQVAHERPDHCLIAADRQNLFTNNSKYLRMIGKCDWLWGFERVKVNKYGEKCRSVSAFFQPLVLEVRYGGMSKTTAKVIKIHAMLARHWMDSDPCFSTGGG